MDHTLNEADAAQMRHIQREIVAVLVKYRHGTEAGLSIFALIRCARALLRRYPKPFQDDMRRLLEDFLAGRTSPRDDPENSLLLMN